MDGGNLLHKVDWKSCTSYRDVLQSYKNYVNHKYRKCAIIFDGTYDKPTTKDHEHARRGGFSSVNIKLNLNAAPHRDRAAFLANSHNKFQLINELKIILSDEGHEVYISNSDADVDIVKWAITKSELHEKVIVVAEDTDVLILLLHHCNEAHKNVYIMQNSKKVLKTYCILTMKNILGQNVVKNLLAAHAWTGCDTTSAIFKIGKISIVKKLMQSNNSVLSACQVLSDPTATQADVHKAGSDLFALSYGAEAGTNLDYLRYLKHMQAVTTSSGVFEPQKLPPTDRAAYFHNLRSHLQIITWVTLNHNYLDPTNWGWKLNETKPGYIPILTDFPVAPEILLNFVRCKCKSSSKNTCMTMQCSCRKNGLKCVAACANCCGPNGSGCGNAAETTVHDEDIFDYAG